LAYTMAQVTLQNAALDLVGRVANDVWVTFLHNWPYLLIGILASAAVSVYVGTDRMSRWLHKRTWVAVGAGVLLATLTPFCSCGTMAVVLSMLAASSPWAPIVAFMVASPLTSPTQLVLSGGLFGWPFAMTYFLGATGLGLGAGGLTHVIERTGWLAKQARMTPEESKKGECKPKTCRACCEPQRTASSRRVAAAPGASIGPGSASVAEFPSWTRRLRVREFAGAVWSVGRRIVPYFFAFATIGYLLVELIPTTAVSHWLGGTSPWAVARAALLGLPVYINTDGSLPMVAALMHAGMGPGPAIAFLITGAGTSVGAVSGMLIIARRRVIGLIVGILLAGAIVLGLLANLLLR
jgi:uncharacterized membrane protein YraQ (UPF0718 family)